MKVYDADIREKLISSFTQVDEFMQDENTIIVNELDVCHGISRVDVAVINGKIHGYEIKSQQDNLERLPMQIQSYNLVFDTMTIVASENHIQKIKEIIPNWWAVIAVKENKGTIKLKKIRKGRKNKNISAEDVAMFLWKEEMIDLLLNHSDVRKGYKSKSRKALSKIIAENIKTEIVQEYVRTTLKNRQGWRAVPIQQICGD